MGTSVPSSMDKTWKIYVGNDQCPLGHVKVSDFGEFKNLIKTLNFSNIEVIVFGKHLDEEGDYPMVYTPTDCAVALVELGRGDKLPQCIVKQGDKDIEEIINHYVESYKFDNYCGKILA